MVRPARCPIAPRERLPTSRETVSRVSRRMPTLRDAFRCFSHLPRASNLRALGKSGRCHVASSSADVSDTLNL